MADPNTTNPGLTERAKIVAQILTDNGHQVDPPDSGTLDDVEWERWNACLQIVQAIDDRLLDTLKRRIDIRLNDYLGEMRPDYDDSIVGFNEAWEVIRKLFEDVQHGN